MSMSDPGGFQGRTEFRHCVDLNAVDDDISEQTEEVRIIFATAANQTIGTCIVEIVDNDGRCVRHASLLLLSEHFRQLPNQ